MKIRAISRKLTHKVTVLTLKRGSEIKFVTEAAPLRHPAKVNDVSGHVLESGKFQVVINANDVTAKYRLYEMAAGVFDYVLVTESGYPIIIESSFNKTSTYAVSAISFFEGTESEKVVIMRLNGDTASYNPHHIFIGKEFTGTAAANPTPGYEYSKLTDGDHSTYFEAKATDSYTVEFDLGYTRSLHEIRIYELNSSRRSYELAGYSEEAIVSVLENIIDGTVSTLLIKDSCHPNAVGYAVAANIMFERMFDIGAFDAIFDYYDSFEA